MTTFWLLILVHTLGTYVVYDSHRAKFATPPKDALLTFSLVLFTWEILAMISIWQECRETLGRVKKWKQERTNQ